VVVTGKGGGVVRIASDQAYHINSERHFFHYQRLINRPVHINQPTDQRTLGVSPLPQWSICSSGWPSRCRASPRPWQSPGRQRRRSPTGHLHTARPGTVISRRTDGWMDGCV